jgi:hypothetical protein
LQEKQQEAVVERCREAYLEMLQRNATGRVLSHRARSHLRQACLAAATHKVLLEEAPVSVVGWHGLMLGLVWFQPACN